MAMRWSIIGLGQKVNFVLANCEKRHVCQHHSPKGDAIQTNSGAFSSPRYGNQLGLFTSYDCKVYSG